MVNVLAHDLKLCLAQWPASEKWYEPGVLREQMGQLFERYPGLRLLNMDALYAEQDLCQVTVSHGRDYLVRVKGNQPTVLATLAEGLDRKEQGEPQAETPEKAGVIELRRILADSILAGYIWGALEFLGARQAAIVEKVKVNIDTSGMKTSIRCAVRDWGMYSPPWSTPD